MGSIVEQREAAASRTPQQVVLAARPATARRLSALPEELRARLLSACRVGTAADREAAWSFAELSGRLCELSAHGDGAALSLAFSLVLDAQRRAEPCAWLSAHRQLFFAPDVAVNGVDLKALPVLVLPGVRACVRAAGHLLRSGGFGLLVLDLGEGAHLEMAAQSRLAAQAQHQHAVVLCLTHKPADRPSLGSLVSLRAHVQRRRNQDGSFGCTLRVLKDKRRGPGTLPTEVFHGPDGLR